MEWPPSYGGIFAECFEEKLGKKVASYLGKADVKVLNYGFENKFYDGVEASVALKERRITPEDTWEDIK